MTHSDKQQFLVYLDVDVHQRMKQFSKRNKISMNKLMREGIEQRMIVGNQYIEGFNDGIKKAMIVVEENQAAQMRFPSGKSFAELINEELDKQIKTNKGDP